MTQPSVSPGGFIVGVNPRLSQSGSIPVVGASPGSPMNGSYNMSPSNGHMTSSPSGQSVQEIEAQIKLQQEQLLAQHALLEQQRAAIREQQEQMAMRQQQIEAERKRLLAEQEHQRLASTQTPQAQLLAQHQAALAQQQQAALLEQQRLAGATATASQNASVSPLVSGASGTAGANHVTHSPIDVRVSSNPALAANGHQNHQNGSSPNLHSNLISLDLDDPPPPPEDDDAPTSYFGNDGMDFDPLPPPDDDIPLPDDEVSSTNSPHVMTMSLSALSDTPVGSLTGGGDHLRSSSQTAPVLISTASPVPKLSPFDQLRSSSPSSPNMSPVSSPHMPAASSSAPTIGHLSSSMNSPGRSSPLGSSGEVRRDEEGGIMRPDDVNTFVPIVPMKKDYGALNAIKDKAIDDLVMFSKQFQIMIKGGTLQKLIERLTFESTTDNDYVDTFLLTYRNFIAPNELLEQLLDRYRTGTAEINPDGVSEVEASNTEKKQKIIRIRVGNVLKRWLSDHYHDFHDPALLARLEAGIADIQEQQLQNMLKKTIQEQQLQKNKIRDLMFSKEKPTPLLPKGPAFDDWDVIEVARQLCLYEQTIYQTIHPKEALNQNWNKHKDKAPNLLKMIAFFNRVSKWVSTQVCLRENFKERVKLIIKFMHLTIQLRQYNNFDCMQAVLSGLNNASVFRMKASWAKIQKEKLYTQWRTMASEITDTTNNSYNYRQAVSHADPPIIPYLGVYLTDLTFTEDGNSNYLKVQDGREDIVNFEKMRRVAVLIKDICTYQQTPYNFEKVPLIYDFFAGDLPFEDDNSLFRRSRVLEPPDVNNPGQVITPKKAKKTISFRRISLGVFSSKEEGESGSSSPKDKKKKDKDKK